MPYLLIIVAIASRFLPHPPNMACMGAIGLFAGCYLAGKKAYLVPLVAMLVSDVIGHAFGVSGMGFYSLVTMACVYAGVLAAVPLGRLLQNRVSTWSVPTAAVIVSAVFFLISNFGVWLGPWYPSTGEGFLACFAAAVPFFGNTLAGDLLASALLFGAYEGSRQVFRDPAFALATR